jgi:hypothetical protein
MGYHENMPKHANTTTGVMDELKLRFSSSMTPALDELKLLFNLSKTPAGSKLGEYYQIL